MSSQTPQIEEGFARIANEILDNLCKINLSAYQTRILLFVFRKTYGYNKKEDWISVSQIVKAVGIHKAHVSRTKKELLLRNLVTSNGNKIAFQKDSRLWKELPKQVTVTNSGKKVTNLGQKLPVQADTKDNIQKTSITINSNRSKDQYGNKNVNFIIDEFKKQTGKIPLEDNSNRIAYNIYQITNTFLKNYGDAYLFARNEEATFEGLITKAWQAYKNRYEDHLPSRLKTFKEHYKVMLYQLQVSIIGK